MRDIEAIVERAAKEARLLMIETVLRGMIVEAREAVIELYGESGVNYLPAVTMDEHGNVAFVVKATNVKEKIEGSSGFQSTLADAALAAKCRLGSDQIEG